MRLLPLAALSVALLTAQSAFAQGQDSTPWERDVMVLAEMLPGQYDNANQSSFDVRLKLPVAERHPRVHTVISRVKLAAFGERVFYRQDYIDGDTSKPARQRIYVLAADNATKAIRMKVFFISGEKYQRYVDAHLDESKLADLTPAIAESRPGCDILWRREAGQFDGRTEAKSCLIQSQVYLAEGSLWQQELTYAANGTLVDGNVDREFFRLVRARSFECYADIPGVSGGRDVVFKRHDSLKLHDQGGTVWWDASVEGQPKRLGIMLRNVEWPINNEKNTFTRNSMVMYVLEKQGDKIVEGPYTWGEPRAERIGINLRWMLVNCFRESRQAAKPTF